jgi:hypothetical protein
MKKFLVQYVRVENQLYSVEVEAKNETQAREKATDIFFEHDYKVVHAEEFINGVQEL